MKYRCHSTLAEIKKEGFSLRGLKLLTGGNRNFPHQLDFTREDISTLQVETVEHMSISGVQDKISLKLRRGRLESVESLGEYILKPVPAAIIPQYSDDVPANEHLTMQIASQIFGISTAANACLYLKDGSMAYITRRFDYRDGAKLAQEDFCQLSARSLETDGRNYKYNGSYEEIGRLVKQYCSAYRVELEKLFHLITFNYLVSNGDAHLKNFSLYETPYGDYVLTPAYDIICSSLHFPNESRTALDLFDEHETEFYLANGYYGREDFLKLAEMYGLQKSRAEKMLGEYAQNKNRVLELIERSFMSAEAKADYATRFQDRLKTVRGV